MDFFDVTADLIHNVYQKFTSHVPMPDIARFFQQKLFSVYDVSVFYSSRDNIFVQIQMKVLLKID